MHRQSVYYQASLFFVSKWRQHAMQQHARNKLLACYIRSLTTSCVLTINTCCPALCGALHLSLHSTLSKISTNRWAMDTARRHAGGKT